ncbi:MAG TPA: AbrB family transcriptional regulator [Geminicoccaceae bacterium]|nr:AbrB family transcriptional regulator [Geminicoccaceae bacterium]
MSSAPTTPSWRRRWAPVAGALTLGAAGGALFVLLGLPLPWMLGAMAATTVASLAGLRIALPLRLRGPMVGVLGVMLGSAFTPEVLRGAALWLPSLAALPLYIALAGGMILLYFRRFTALDPVSAYFSATPGGLSEMVIVGDRMGGDVRTIALAHSVRVLLVIFLVPFVASWFDPAVADRGVLPAGPPLAAGEVVVLLLAALAGLLAATWLRLPAGVLLGPMLGSAAVHLAGWVHGPPPSLLVAVAQVVIGASVGVRFAGVSLIQIARMLGLGVGSTTVMLAISLVFGFALHGLTGLPLAALLLAFIPGGLAEMSLVALAMHTDPAFVATHHIARIFLVVSFAPLVFRWLARPAPPT